MIEIKLNNLYMFHKMIQQTAHIQLTFLSFIISRNVHEYCARILCGNLSSIRAAFNENTASKQLEKATISVLREGNVKTPDLGGKNTTNEIAEEIISKL
jgi:isocitrate/isopropylmalate dehydrogenase